MNADITSVTHTLPVPDPEAGRRFYSELLGREPDHIPAPAVYEWKLCPAVWLQVAAGAPAADISGQTLRLGVSDLESAVSAFEALTGSRGERIVIPDLITIQDLRDPFGNRLSFYEEVDGR